MKKKQITHLQLTINETKCGKKVTKDNLVVDVNVCTCKKCRGL